MLFLWDTGASFTTLDCARVFQLGLLKPDTFTEASAEPTTAANTRIKLYKVTVPKISVPSITGKPICEFINFPIHTQYVDPATYYDKNRVRLPSLLGMNFLQMFRTIWLPDKRLIQAYIRPDYKEAIEGLNKNHRDFGKASLMYISDGTD